ncbi:histone deacetylase RPD3 [Flagelloscypha sp. PMI_526]|nr:histone deacetylase RPD3 [Flagelloscypha sp. PMI_526]
MSKRRVAYYYDTDTGAYTYGLGHAMKPARMKLTHEIVRAYVTPETAEELTFGGSRFLMLSDNPVFDGVFEFCQISAGGSIGAAERIASGSADVAINWAGGLHHAKKAEAAGFCYINDIVLCILELLRTYPRVLYIDIDCHHGDGVEEAFYTTDRVLTCSFHKFGEFFPGTGTSADQGRGKGKGYSVNLPLKDGLTDESLKSIYDPVISKILEVFRPSVVVLQCGADSLAGDKLGCFNVSMQGHAACVQFFQKHPDLPLIVLGGGGYTWTYETACCLGIEHDIDLNMPWNDFFEWFGPRYKLEVPTNNMIDHNITDGSIHRLRQITLEQLNALGGPPSVQIQDVPRESVNAHLQFTKPQQVTTDKLDDELANNIKYLYDLQASDSDSSNSDSDTESDLDGSEHASVASSSKRQSSVIPRSVHSPSPSVFASPRKRMSIMDSKYYEVPDEPNHMSASFGVRRKFFQSELGFDEKVGYIIRERRPGEGASLPKFDSIDMLVEEETDNEMS